MGPDVVGAYDHAWLPVRGSFPTPVRLQPRLLPRLVVLAAAQTHHTGLVLDRGAEVSLPGVQLGEPSQAVHVLIFRQVASLSEGGKRLGGALELGVGTAPVGL